MRPVKGATLVLGALMLFGSACSDDADTPVEAQSTMKTGFWLGFSASVSSTADHGDGTATRSIELSNVPLSNGVLVLGLHPSTGGLSISTSQVPAGGHLVLCESSLEGRNREECLDVSGGSEQQMLDLLGGGSHQGLVISGTWQDRTIVASITISYEAEDDFFAMSILA